MGQIILGFEETEKWVAPDIGDAVEYIGEFDYPYFFYSERSVWHMMKPFSAEVINYRTLADEVYQFRLSSFHGKGGLLLTSTLKDTFLFMGKSLYKVHNIDETMSIARKGQERYNSKTAYSGYVCWGGYFEQRYERLMKNMASQHIYLTDEALNSIYKELKRRSLCQD